MVRLFNIKFIGFNMNNLMRVFVFMSLVIVYMIFLVGLIGCLGFCRKDLSKVRKLFLTSF